MTLVGDAGYCPGPAVKGSTSLAVYGAYVLAGEIEKGGWRSPLLPSPRYEHTMMPSVLGSRSLARVNAKTLVPGSRWGVRALVGTARAGIRSPARRDPGPGEAATGRGVRLYDSDAFAPIIRP